MARSETFERSINIQVSRQLKSILKQTSVFFLERSVREESGGATPNGLRSLGGFVSVFEFRS